MATQREIFDYLFHTKLSSWTPLSAPHHELFTEEELAVLERSNRTFRTSGRTVVVLSFENRFASLGGLGAVIRQFPGALHESGESVILLTPLHRNSASVGKALSEGLLKERCRGVPVHICSYSCEADCYEETGAPVPTFHIGITGRFSAGDNPYGYDDAEELLFDALAFSAVVPSVLDKLGYTTHLLFHAHDWEASPIAVFARFAVISSVLKQAKTVLTLHNSFDAPFPDRLKVLFFNKKLPGDTVLQCIIPFLHGPLSAVSTPFAHELRHDPLQRGFFADHLQLLFRKNPPLGIENGMFGEPKVPFDRKDIDAAAQGNFAALLQKKKQWRSTFLKTLKKAKDRRIVGILDDASLDNPDIPVFFMSGRFDVMQKGFDVLFQAFSRLQPGTAHLFFTPTLHNGDDDLSFFREIVDRCKGTIVIWPFLLSSQQYRTFLQGASYLLMPSMYEPFGAATEGFLHGTPLVARATGGLLAQIHPGRDFTTPRLYTSLIPVAPDDNKNGILYRENYPDGEAEKFWRSLLTAPLARRIDNPLYRSMVEAGCQAVNEACTLFTDKDAYGAMIYSGLHSVQQHTWTRAVEKYRQLYDSTVSRGC